MRLPSFQFYPRDWRGHVGVQSLSFHDRGVWFEMICLMHDSEQRGKMILNGRSMTDEQIARSLGLDNQILTTTLTTLLTSGVATRCEETGAVCSKRMVDDEKLRQIRTKAGKMGGNPALLNQNSTTQVNQNSTPTTTTAFASSVVSKIRDSRIPETEEDAIRLMSVASGVPDEAVRLIFLEAKGVDMVDWKGKPIKDWSAYCRHKFLTRPIPNGVPTLRGHSKPRSQYDLQAQIDTIKEHIGTIQANGRLEEDGMITDKLTPEAQSQIKAARLKIDELMKEKRGLHESSLLLR